MNIQQETDIKNLEQTISNENEKIKMYEEQLEFIKSDNSISETEKGNKRFSVKHDIFKCKDKIMRAETGIKTCETRDQKAIERAEKQETQEQKELEQAQELEAMYNHFRKYIRDNNLFYVHKADTYMRYFEDSDSWVPLKVRSMGNILPELMESGVQQQFTQAMVDADRNYTSMMYTFKKVPKHTLNLLMTGHWLKPTENYQNDVSEWFELLTQSLGGGKAENIEHIKQVLYWKYKHPDSFQLPCMVIYGNGGVGKNILSDIILKTVFGHNQSVTVSMDEVTGSFNSMIAGKTCVYIDEACADKANMNALKTIVNNKEFTVNEKYIPTYKVDNTALYMTGGNGSNGAVRLGDDDSDRRWSIIKVNASLVKRVMKHFSVDKTEAEDMIQNAIDTVFSNPVEVSKWLAQLIQENSGLKSMPRALHGDDYRDLITIQSGPLEVVLQGVFDDPDFTYITKKILFRLFKQIADEDNPSGMIFKKTNFQAKVDAWLERYKPEIKAKDKLNIKHHSSNSSTTNVYYRTDLVGRLDKTDDNYMNSDGYCLPEHKVQVDLSIVKDSKILDLGIT